MDEKELRQIQAKRELIVSQIAVTDSQVASLKESLKAAIADADSKYGTHSPAELETKQHEIDKLKEEYAASAARILAEAGV